MDQARTGGGRSVVLARLGFWSALTTALVGAAALGVAVTTPPRSGPFAATGSAIAFPYADAARFVPRDFLWMYPATLMLLSLLVLATCLRERAAAPWRVLGTVGMNLTTIAVGIVAVDYFIQLLTVQPALLNDEGASVAALTQYNPHGVFITLETLGFVLLSVGLGFLAFTLGRSRLERVVFWVFLGCASLDVAALIAMWSYLGFGLEYFYEVAVISVLWLSLIVSSGLLAVVFGREVRTFSGSHRSASR